MNSLFVCTVIFSIFNLNSPTEQLKNPPNCIEGLEISGSQNQIGGYALSSEGIMNVLIIFCQFPDDNYNTTDPYWVKGQPPTNMSEWIDETWSNTPTEGSLTHYFNTMSFEKFKFIGKTEWVISPHTRQWYLDEGWKRGDIHKEIIQNLDQTLDFAQFDNWDLDSPYFHSNQPDNIVEMIIMIWRNIALEFPPSQSSEINSLLNMSNYGSLGGTPFTVDNGAKTIKTGFFPNGSIPGGSGITVTNLMNHKSIRHTLHEFAHYLMGGNTYHTGNCFWGMLRDWAAKSQVANSFERYRLGWINVNTVNNSPNQTILNATIPDYVTTGVVYRLNIDPSSNEYFYIENHQNIDYWENTLNPGTVENGLYIIRQEGSLGSQLQLVPADGRFDWTVNQLVENPWGSDPDLLPVYKNLGADRVDGYHDLELIPWTWNGAPQTPMLIHYTENENGAPVVDVRYPGDGKDAFRIGFNEVFSPWSNPNSQDVNRTATPFGFKINSFNGGVYSIDIYVNTAEDAPPSKPQNLSVEPDTDQRPYLTWDANQEPDVVSFGYYNVSKKKYYDGSWHWDFLAHTANNYYLDTSERYCPTGQTCVNYINIYYRVTAIDNDLKESVPSDSVVTRVVSYVPNKIDSDNHISLNTGEFVLAQNYPNPFNPKTTITSSTKRDGWVS